MRLQNMFGKMLCLSWGTLTIAGLYGCTEPTWQTVSRPPLAVSPAPQVIFGESNLTEKGGLKVPLNKPKELPSYTQTLVDCIEQAKKVSPALDSADQNYLGAIWNRWQSVATFLPKASVSYGVIHSDDSGSTPNLWSRDMTVTLPIFTGGRNVANYLLSQLGISTADIQRTRALDDLLLMVKQVYFDILTLEKSLEVAQSNVINLQSHLRVTQLFNEFGKVPKNQVLEAEVSLAQALQAETALTHQLITSKAHMNILLRQPLDQQINLEDILTYHPFPFSMQECIDISLKKNPEIRLALKQIEASAKNIDVARSSYYPQVEATWTNAAYGETSTIRGSAVWNETLAAKVDLWNWGLTKADVEKSKIEMNRSIDALTRLEDATKLEVATDYQRLLSAGKNIDVSIKAIAAAAAGLDIVIWRYKEMVATNTDVLDSMSRYNLAQYEYYSALYNYNLAWATLERSMGQEVSY